MIISLESFDTEAVGEMLRAVKERPVRVVPKIDVERYGASIEGSLFGVGEKGVTVEDENGKLAMIAYDEVNLIQVRPS